MGVLSNLTVDWEQSPRVITVLAPATSITIQDLHDTLTSSFEDCEEGGQHPRLVVSEGKADLGEGLFTGITLTLQNALLAFEDRITLTQCFIRDGNLVSVDDVGAVLQTPIYPTAFTQVNLSRDTSAAIKGIDNIETKLDELHRLAGLDASNPMTATPTSRVAGDIDLDITGDGETSSTVTRNP